MADELGRGLLSSWSDARWQQLDKLAVDTVAGLATFRQVFQSAQQTGAFTVRIAGQDVSQTILTSSFDIDLIADAGDDINRYVIRAARSVALAEDQQAADNVPRTTQQHYTKDLDCFAKAREQMVEEGVDSGYVVVVSPDVLADLEGITIGGAATLRSAVEGLLGTTLLVSAALGGDLTSQHYSRRVGHIVETLKQLKSQAPAADAPIATAVKALSQKYADEAKIVALLAETSPQVGAIVQTFSPRLRVLAINGTSASLRVEEGVAIAPFNDAIAVVLKK